MPPDEQYSLRMESEIFMTELTIIIPAFNESRKIAADILAADKFLSSEGISGEIIVVDDGSADDTADIARKTGQSIQSDSIVEQLGRNLGKGRAVRCGILKSRGEFVVFVDSGCCIPYREIKRGVELIRSGQCQIAHGSRKMKNCHIIQPQSPYRKICSQLFHWFLIRDIKKLSNLTDTQCGFKVYLGSVARTLYAESQIDGFMFDVEVILLALSGGHTICEFPVDWSWDPDSRLKPGHEAIRVLTDLIKLKRQFRSFLKKNDK